MMEVNGGFNMAIVFFMVIDIGILPITMGMLWDIPGLVNIQIAIKHVDLELIYLLIAW
jgi:hypothetical protein